ncbi:glycerophosphodiester phosphodiesterase [Aquibium oceanicum]|uniref:Glycerophosphodiester phosphodiesterase n=1 Tax=Aquibium oceanicum TaxID=1670800 RepID=A0A1L3SSU2_9HYPH|nr:glycerophosphodiester phosphodiesterase [Aquibium oceanicum]APH72487.1 glycerophosphodiester phosphodiesterase [Aquibium oceanicum]
MTDISWMTKRPIAHRGYHDLNVSRWENTLSAFAAAIEKNFAIECDVHLSADGVPVVFHDDKLDRLAGADGFVWQRSAAEMAALSIGGTADHAPSLSEMLEFVGGRVPLVIELKGIPGHDEGLVARVAELLRGYSGHAAIMSFDHWLVRRFPAEASGIPCGLTACGTKTHELEAHFSMLGHGIDFVSYGVFDLPNPFVTFVKEKLSMPVITWTVRKPREVEDTFRHADQMTFEGFDPDA